MIAERVRRAAAGMLCLAALASATAQAAPLKQATQPPPRQPDAARTAIASAHPLATAAGFEVLESGGNAFDAAIAVAATLAVVEPHAAGLGGGGLFLLHDVRRKETLLLDALEEAPSSAVPDMYRNARGEFVEDWAANGPPAAAIPGMPAAIVHLAARHGLLPLATSLRPAIRLARDGFPVDERYRQSARSRLEELRRFVDTSSIFLFKGDVPAFGTLIRQPDLAGTLDAIARGGHDGFYRGPLAARLVDAVVESGGIWTVEDLARYQVIERAPLAGEFRGARVVTAPPPSAGGTLLMETLDSLGALDFAQLQGADRDHRLIEALQGAAGKSPLVSRKAGMAIPEGNGGTHFAVLDREGNRVSATLGLHQSFGSAFVAKGVGILLNNRMAAFAAASDGEGLNAIAAGSRPLSFAAPTFIEYNDRIALLGAAGGIRVPAMIVQQLLGLLEARAPSAVLAEPRFGPAYHDGNIECEPEYFGSPAASGLRGRGHVIRSTGRPYGNAQIVLWEKAGGGQASAASDPRGAGHAAAR